MKKLLVLVVISAGLMFASCSNEDSSNKAAKEENKAKFDSTDLKRDADFAVAAAQGGMMEVDLGKLAMENGSSPSVKQFGQSMVTDHSNANEELKTMAASKNISLPAVPDNK